MNYEVWRWKYDAINIPKVYTSEKSNVTRASLRRERGHDESSLTNSDASVPSSMSRMRAWHQKDESKPNRLRPSRCTTSTIDTVDTFSKYLGEGREKDFPRSGVDLARGA